MVNTQQWLDANYPKEERDRILLLYLNEPNLEGELDLADFTKLERIDVSQTAEENKISFKNKPEEAEVKKCVDAQKWLDEWYPKGEKCKDEDKIWENNGRRYKTNFGKTRSQITELSIIGRGLEGSLDISGFENLEKLDCSYNHLTSLNVSNLEKLKDINCQKNKLTNLQLKNCPKLDSLLAFDNDLTELDISSLEDKVTYIYLNDNPQLKDDLSVFRSLKNLGVLWLNNTAFGGSIETLQNLDKLECLSIADTDIDSGLEYLPNSVGYFYCSTDKKKDAKCQAIYNLLTNEQGEIEFDEMTLGEEFEKIKFKYVSGFEEKLQVIKNKAKERLYCLFKDELQTKERQIAEQSNKVQELTEELHLSQSQIQQLSNLVLPDQVYDFSTLEREIKKLKTNELIPSLQNKKQELEQLIANTKIQLSEELEQILELYCQVLNEEDSALKEGKLMAYQTILQGKLSKEELQVLATKQTEVSQLEKQLNNLQNDNQQLEAKIIQV